MCALTSGPVLFEDHQPEHGLEFRKYILGDARARSNIPSSVRRIEGAQGRAHSFNLQNKGRQNGSEVEKAFKVLTEHSPGSNSEMLWPGSRRSD